MKKLYVDFDNTIVDSVKQIVSLYNDDHHYYRNFIPVKSWDVDTWDFRELYLEPYTEICKYFTQSRFFRGLEWMDNAENVLRELSKDYQIIVVSIGVYENLVGKAMWLMKNMSYAKFRPILVDVHTTKKCVDMSDGYLIDDRYEDLISSNAYKNICFGDVCSWNNKWTGTRCFNWYDVKRFLREEDSRSD